MTLWGLEVTDLSATGLLSLVVVLILIGWLVPRSTHNETKNERDRWRKAYEAEREARSNAEVQTQELIERTRRIHDNLYVKHGANDAPVEGDE